MALLEENNRVRVFCTNPDAKLPQRAHRTDAGMDFFFCPHEGVAKRIMPGESTLLGTGVKMEVPPGCMLQIMNKSGVASKKSLVTGACVVDGASHRFLGGQIRAAQLAGCGRRRRAVDARWLQF